jgi:hypothetical protein
MCRWAALTLALATVPLGVTAQSINVRASQDSLHLRSTGLGFLEGQVSERLKDGRTVRVDFVLTVLEKPDGTPVATAEHSFNLSFDLWEQRFAVTRVGKPPRSISHLTARDAEAWCLDNITLPLSAMGRLRSDTPFWVRLAYRVLERMPAGRREDESFTLWTLIDVLSRRRQDQDGGQSVEAGPFRLSK